MSPLPSPPAPLRRARHLSLCLLLFLSVSISNVEGADVSGDENQLTPKAYLLRYWKEHTSNNLPAPAFLMDKASPLTAAHYSEFLKISGNHSLLSARLVEFCTQAEIACFPEADESVKSNGKESKLLDQSFRRYYHYNEADKENKLLDQSFRRYYHYNEADKENKLLDQSFRRYYHYNEADKENKLLDQSFRRYYHYNEAEKENKLLDQSFRRYYHYNEPEKENTLLDQSFRRYYHYNEPEKENKLLDQSFRRYYHYNEPEKENKLLDQSFRRYYHYNEGKKTVSTGVPPGLFFREAMLKPGTLMPMPDIRDKYPRRSFLPRGIASKLPFSTSNISEIRRIFRADDNSAMSKVFSYTLEECERAPSNGETMRCVASIEDLIDFATSRLGRSVAVRATATTAGYDGEILLGEVKGINGGKELTNSISCHKIFYPYLVYSCHLVPKVRVYEADILDPKSKSKINHGIAICHKDTSTWSPDYVAFRLLGPGPGKIEVCHWMFQNDMTWAATR